jgi:hypothetical protein
LEVEQKLPLLQLLVVRHLRVARTGRLVEIVPVGDRRVEEKLAEALHRQNVERTFGRFNQVGQPRHGLIGALPLQNVQEKVGVPAPAQQMSDFVMLKK